MSQRTQAHPDDVVLVSREHLAVLLMWAARQPSPAVPLNAQAQLEAELMALEPPENWFTGERDGGRAVGRRRVAAVVVVCCSALLLAGLGVAWLLLGVVVR